MYIIIIIFLTFQTYRLTIYIYFLNLFHEQRTINFKFMKNSILILFFSQMYTSNFPIGYKRNDMSNQVLFDDLTFDKGVT